MGELNKIHGEWVDFGALIDAVTRPAEPPRKRPSASRSRWGTDLGTERKKGWTGKMDIMDIMDSDHLRFN
jgi:hypothetical protein